MLCRALADINTLGVAAGLRSSCRTRMLRATTVRFSCRRFCFLSVDLVTGRPYRPLPRAVDLESIQSVIFATTANWPIPYRTLRSSVSLRLPPQTTLGKDGERRMLEVRE